MSSLLARMNSSTLFSLIVVGTTDALTVEQLSFLIRFVVKNTKEIQEDFLAFIPTSSCTGQAIANQILTCFTRFSLLPGNCIDKFLDNILSALFLCRMPTYMSFSNILGQAYDGAPNMSSILNGCQAIIKQLCVEAEYMHCSSHGLNLALVDSCSSSFIRNMFGTIKSIIEFFNDSAKRTDALKKEITRSDNEYV